MLWFSTFFSTESVGVEVLGSAVADFVGLAVVVRDVVVRDIVARDIVVGDDIIVEVLVDDVATVADVADHTEVVGGVTAGVAGCSVAVASVCAACVVDVAFSAVVIVTFGDRRVDVAAARARK